MNIDFYERFYKEKGITYPVVDISVRCNSSNTRVVYFFTFIEKRGRMVPVSEEYTIPIDTFADYREQMDEVYRLFAQKVQTTIENFIINEFNSIHK